MRTTRAGGLILIAAALCAAALVYFGNPDGKRGILLPCFFHKATGLYCPGCGATRGTWHLLHGDIGKALDSNLLLPLILGIVGYEFTRSIATMLFAKKLPAIRPPRTLLYAALALVAAFTVLRNLPYESCMWLAP